ncbi:MAG: cysteine--tRNA ligase [Planctomycetia bacterium]|nr:cysteine--tRNA ligase [Planctomycetia bacterium]
MLRVYNTLSRDKEPLEPVTPGKIGVYLCGPTVYKPSHIGHMVGPVIFDTVKKYLVYNGFDVTWVVNITDVDDKLIRESNHRGIPMSRLAAEMTEDYQRNLAALGVDGIDHFPKATEYMNEIIDFVQSLIDKGAAYASDGDVYFDVSKCDHYGKLSHRETSELIGEGGSTADRKRNAADFALWKSAKPDEPSWESPWGPGRPGWHIECSVMSYRLLGRTFDIHGGGLDLMFPHHENEIAQSETLFDCPMAKYWMHNGLMQASDEVGKVGGRATRSVEPTAKEGDLTSQEGGKISKSKGAAAFRDMLETYAPETIRFFLLATHYRRPIDFSDARLHETETALETFYRFFRRFERITGAAFHTLPIAKTRMEGDVMATQTDMLREIAELRTRFLEAMDDDFNTGGATGVLFDLVRRLNRFVDESKLESAATQTQKSELTAGATRLAELGAILGLFRNAPPDRRTDGDGTNSEGASLTGELIRLLIELRAEARKKKDFATADQIRNRLTELGVVLEDRPDGTEWSLRK